MNVVSARQQTAAERAPHFRPRPGAANATTAPTATERQLFCFNSIVWQYDPYPIGAARGVFDDDIYALMNADWPALDLFEYKSKLGHKYSLSEVNHPRQYAEFIESTPIWRQLHATIKSEAFVTGIIEMLAAAQIDLGLLGKHAVVNHRRRGVGQRLGDAWRAFQGTTPDVTRLTSRFEFSMLPADGGCIRPHTDGPRKLITLVVSVARPGEWNPDWGGGTAALRPKDMRRNFNFVNQYLDFDETEFLHEHAFVPNQCVVFVKTFNSLHAVAPMTGHGSKQFRKTLTINIES